VTELHVVEQDRWQSENPDGTEHHVFLITKRSQSVIELVDIENICQEKRYQYGWPWCLSSLVLLLRCFCERRRDSFQPRRTRTLRFWIKSIKSITSKQIVISSCLTHLNKLLKRTPIERPTTILLSDFHGWALEEVSAMWYLFLIHRAIYMTNVSHEGRRWRTSCEIIIPMCRTTRRY